MWITLHSVSSFMKDNLARAMNFTQQDSKYNRKFKVVFTLDFFVLKNMNYI